MSWTCATSSMAAMRRSTDALRISVELSEAPSGQVIWSERFDGQPDHLFDLQDHIAASAWQPPSRFSHSARSRIEPRAAKAPGQHDRV